MLFSLSESRGPCTISPAHPNPEISSQAPVLSYRPQVTTRAPECLSSQLSRGPLEDPLFPAQNP